MAPAPWHSDAHTTKGTPGRKRDTMMRFFDACVRNGRLVLDASIDLAEGTPLELASTDDVLSNGGDLLDADERAALALDLEAADAEINVGETIDFAEAMAELRAEHAAAHPELGRAVGGGEHVDIEEIPNDVIGVELPNSNHPMRFFDACVRNGRLVLDAPTDLAEDALLELVSTDDVLSNGGDLLDADERAALSRDLCALIAEADAGEGIPLAEAMAELRAKHSRRSRHQRRRDLNGPSPLG